MSGDAQYKDKTDFPEIFETTYWGAFKATDTSPEPEIIENRNALVRDYALVKRSKRTYPQYVTKHFGLEFDWPYGLRFWDHVEVLENATEYIVISSPYGPADYEIREGFEAIPPVYSSSAKSYLGRVPKKTRGGAPNARGRDAPPGRPVVSSIDTPSMKERDAKQESFANDLEKRGHVCIKILEVIPGMTSWCGQEPCAKLVIE